jgi:hypothetical protein
VSAALRWTPDSNDRILRRDDPIEIPDEIPDRVTYRTVDADDDLETLDRAAAAIADGALAIRAAVQRLKEKGR